MLEKLAIKYISYYLRKNEYNNIEVVIRSNGSTCYKRNKARENSINETLKLIR